MTPSPHLSPPPAGNLATPGHGAHTGRGGGIGEGVLEVEGEE
jgi:hypothetical protein